MKPIVTDTYDFPTLIGEGYVYVDKTALLRRMISGVDGRRIVCVGVNYDTLRRNVDTLNDTLSNTLNDTLRLRMLSLIRQRPGLRRPDLMAALNVSESTVARCLRELRASVVFCGAPKIGGYYILERS